MVGLVAALAVAPPVLFLVPLNPDTSQNLGFISDHAAAYGVGGLTIRTDSAGRDHVGWAHSESVEAVWKRLYGELRIEDLEVGERVRFWTVRTGYLFHPYKFAAGGFTLAYRWAEGQDVQDGIGLGLPFAMGNDRAAMLFEPTYLFSSRGVSWTHRVRFEGYIPQTPIIVGAWYDIKPVRQGGSYHAAMTLIFGVRTVPK
jgi:hypothetical protein